MDNIEFQNYFVGVGFWTRHDICTSLVIIASGSRRFSRKVVLPAMIIFLQLDRAGASTSSWTKRMPT